MQYVSVRSVASRLKSRFKVDMDIFDVVQASSEALKKMGGIALERVGIVAKVQDFAINLPGTVWKVRGVKRLDAPFEPPFKIIQQDIYFPPQIVFEFEVNELELKPVEYKDNYISQFKGPYIDYTWDAPFLRFNENGGIVAIEATQIKKDSEGFPMIPEPMFFGCLFYALYAYYEPLYLLGQIPDHVMTRVTEWKNNNVAQSNAAMMMEALTSNERDNLMSIMTSMDRKSFNLPS